MAGDWIPMRVDLHDDPAVIGIAKATGLDDDSVVGKLLRIWGWAQGQTADGSIPNANSEWIDRKVSCKGFAEAMIANGWLMSGPNAIVIPQFERWLGRSAKDRIQAARRMSTLRRERNKNVTTEQDSTEENSNSNSSAAAADCERLLKTLEERGLSPALARKAVETSDQALILEVCAYHAEQKHLRNPVAALRNMLSNPVEWGFENTSSGWRRPSAPQPPGETAEQRAARLAQESKKYQDFAAEAERDDAKTRELMRQRQKKGVEH